MKKLLQFQDQLFAHLCVFFNIILTFLGQEVRTLGSAQDRGASMFSVGDRFHSVLLFLIVTVLWNMKSIISKKFQ